MRRRIASKAERGRITSGQVSSTVLDGPNGFFQIGALRIIASEYAGWDHVSVSLTTRCPTWDEMERVRGWFFADDETVIQFSPPRDAERVNCHPYCLHLWRQQKVPAPKLPPTILVGIPTGRAMTTEERQALEAWED